MSILKKGAGSLGQIYLFVVDDTENNIPNTSVLTYAGKVNSVGIARLFSKIERVLELAAQSELDGCIMYNFYTPWFFGPSLISVLALMSMMATLNPLAPNACNCGNAYSDAASLASEIFVKALRGDVKSFAPVLEVDLVRLVDLVNIDNCLGKFSYYKSLIKPISTLRAQKDKDNADIYFKVECNPCRYTGEILEIVLSLIAQGIDGWIAKNLGAKEKLILYVEPFQFLTINAFMEYTGFYSMPGLTGLRATEFKMFLINPKAKIKSFERVSNICSVSQSYLTYPEIPEYPNCFGLKPLQYPESDNIYTLVAPTLEKALPVALKTNLVYKQFISLPVNDYAKAYVFEIANFISSIKREYPTLPLVKESQADSILDNILNFALNLTNQFRDKLKIKLNLPISLFRYIILYNGNFYATHLVNKLFISSDEPLYWITAYILAKHLAVKPIQIGQTTYPLLMFLCLIPMQFAKGMQLYTDLKSFFVILPSAYTTLNEINNSNAAVFYPRVYWLLFTSWIEYLANEHIANDSDVDYKKLVSNWIERNNEQINGKFEAMWDLLHEFS